MIDPDVKLIQKGLLGLDHNPGPIDGRFGTLTRVAAERWLAAGGKRAASAPPALPTSLVIYQGSARYPVREIIVHCAATQPHWKSGETLAAKVAEIRRWHVQGNGWRDIGYHWVIDRDGQMAPGRAETVIGAGVEGHNQGVIHICLIGGHGSASTDRFSRHFTLAQDQMLRQQIAGISVRTRIDRVSGHNEWAGKACPGFDVPTWYREAA